MPSSRTVRAEPAPISHDEWQRRADALDPDRWLSPEAVLHGVEHADALFDELRRDLGMTHDDAMRDANLLA